jgi:hypothetical protein
LSTEDPITTSARVAEAVARQERGQARTRYKERLEKRIERRAYSVAEVAAMIGADRSSVHRWVEASTIKSVKIGHRRFILASELARLLGEASA